MARLNPQGLARRDKGLLSCILPDPGFVTISLDLGSGEPTVTSHYSQDPMYRYACFDGVGKAPHWRGGVNMIDDIYLMMMSISPLGARDISEAWSRDWSGKTFIEQWLEDAEVIKTALKKQRQFHKMACLGFGYGMGAKKFIKQAYDAGFVISEKDARALHSAYWELFAGVKALSDRLGREIKRKGFIVNAFGYRLTPPPQKAFNFLIQSSVSGIMHVFCAKLLAIAPYARFRTVIHDELVCDVPEHLVDDFRFKRDEATESLNRDLNWSVKIRTGFAPGSDWYTAK